MKFSPSHALLGAALLASAPAAYADTPILSGSYTMTLETICPATQAVDAAGKTLTIKPKSPGEVSHVAGILNFFTTGGTAGMFKTSTATTDGAAIVSTVNGKHKGKKFSLADSQNFGDYSQGEKSLTLTYDKQRPQIFDAVYGNVDANGIIQSADLLAVTDDKTPCGTDVILHLQQPSGR